VDAVLADIVTCTASDGTGSGIAGYGEGDFSTALANPAFAHVRHGLPFRRLTRDASGRWLYWCPSLGADGRCRSYDSRPAPCRALQPGASKPCCHYVTGIGACPERAVPGLIQTKPS
jgi:Fe-S-cluster containining protein